MPTTRPAHAAAAVPMTSGPCPDAPLRAIVASWSLTGEIAAVAELVIFERLGLTATGARLGISKQAVARRVQILREKLYDCFLTEMRIGKSCGAESLDLVRAHRELKARLDGR